MKKWTEESYEAFRKELVSMGEAGYKAFHEKLLCSALPVIGIRVPVLRKLAAKLAREDGEGFLAVCGRNTYEERLLYGLTAELLPVSYEEFLPYCDVYTETLAENWAHTDVFVSSLKKRIKGREKDFFVQTEKYLRSVNPWAVRMGLVILRAYYLKGETAEECLKRAGAVKSDFYYVKMAQAWLFADAWVYDKEKTWGFMEQIVLDNWVFNKFIQKCCESRRVSQEDKNFLKTQKRSDSPKYP